MYEINDLSTTYQIFISVTSLFCLKVQKIRLFFLAKFILCFLLSIDIF